MTTSNETSGDSMKNLIGSKVHQYEYNLFMGGSQLGDRNVYTESIFTIKLQNEKMDVIDDTRFTSLYVDCPYNDKNSLDKSYLLVNINDKFFGDGILFNLYSSKELSKESIKTMILGLVKKKVKVIGCIELTELSNKIDKVMV